MFKELRPAVISFLLLSLFTGVGYPLLVTGISQLTMPGKANGSLILKEGKPVGSELIGQPFSDPKYFWGRLSATGPMPYNASNSGGSNLGPTNPALLDAVKARVQALHDADPGNTQPVPVDLVTASGSGLDPHISPAAVEYQLARVARVRNLGADAVRKLVAEHTEGRQFGILGEPRVNVLELNLALDAMR
jgi:K+-transporting ATPase ATPase C chain